MAHCGWQFRVADYQQFANFILAQLLWSSNPVITGSVVPRRILGGFLANWIITQLLILLIIQVAGSNHLPATSAMPGPGMPPVLPGPIVGQAGDRWSGTHEPLPPAVLRFTCSSS